MKVRAMLVRLASAVALVASTLSCGASLQTPDTSSTSTRGRLYFGKLAGSGAVGWQTRFYREYAATILEAMQERPLWKGSPPSHTRTYRVLVSRSVDEQIVIALRVEADRCTMTEKSLDGFSALAIDGDSGEVLEFRAGDLHVKNRQCSVDEAREIEKQFKVVTGLPDSFPSSSMVDGTVWFLESMGAKGNYKMRTIYEPQDPAIRQLAKVLCLPYGAPQPGGS